MPAHMTDQEVKAFLDTKPGWIVLSTLGRGGYPHSVPLGYFRLGDDVYIGCRAGTQKLKNIERNPNVSLLLESGATRKDRRGVRSQGQATVHTDPETALRLSREAARLRGVAEDALPREPRPGGACIQVERSLRSPASHAREWRTFRCSHTASSPGITAETPTRPDSHMAWPRAMISAR